MPQTKLRTMKQKPAEIRQPKQATRPERKLTDFQEIVCDLFADLIFNGGQAMDVEHVLRGLAQHQYNKMLNDCGDGEKAKEHAKAVLPSWTWNLASGMTKRSENSDEQAEPKSYLEDLKLTLRDSARRDFDEFMKDATPFEMYLMKDILSERTGMGVALPGVEYIPEVPLASAIDRVLGYTSRSYLRVPEGAVDLVRILIHSGQMVKEGTVNECA